jgi:FAD/FMN-containing dehydrogenase
MLAPNRAFVMPPDGWEPKGVLFPKSAEEISSLLRRGRRVVAWGGGTGLMGSAAPTGGEVVLDMRRMNRVRIESERAYAQAGATLQQVEEAARKHGLTLGHDPWTVNYATVGGAFNTDGVGYLAGRYGTMAQMVIGLTAVLGDGTIVTKRPARKTSTGFNLANILAGTEGTLAVVTELVLRLTPIPEARAIRAYAFPDFESGFEAARRIVDTGPALLDFNESFPEGAKYFPWGGEEDRKPTLYLVYEGPKAVVRGQLRTARKLLRGADRRSAAEYWKSRHDIADFVARDRHGRSKADEWMSKVRFDYIHVALPIDRVLGYHRLLLKLMRRRNVLMLETGIWVHPELYSAAFLRPQPADAAEMQSAVDEALLMAHRMGGSMEYVHGVGKKLAHLLRQEHGAALDAYDRLKKAWDPAGTLPILGRSRTGGRTRRPRAR